MKIPPRAWSTYLAIAKAPPFEGWSANDGYNKQKWPGITPAQYYVLREAWHCLVGGDTSVPLSKALVERWLQGATKEVGCYAQQDLVAKASAAFGKK